MLVRKPMEIMLSLVPVKNAVEIMLSLLLVKNAVDRMLSLVPGSNPVEECCLSCSKKPHQEKAVSRVDK